MLIKNVFNTFVDNINTYIYFFILMYLQLVVSMNLSSYGTTFVDLKFILHSSIDRISLVILFQSCGFLIGCSFGFVYKWLNRQLTMAILLFICSIVVVLIPFSLELWHLYLCSLVTGTGYGIYFNSNNVWLLELFGNNAGPMLQLSGFIYGAGTILGPLLFQPYVTGEIPLFPQPEDQFSALSFTEDLFVFGDNETALTYNQTYYSTLNTNESFVGSNAEEDGLRRSKLKIPFLVCGIIVIIGAIILLGLFFFRRYRINLLEIEKKDEHDGKLTGDSVMGKIVIILCMLLFCFHSASDDTYIQFTATYLQYIPLGLTASKSAEIVSYMGLVFTLSQGISIFIAIKIRPQYMLAYHYAILLTGILIMYFGKNSLTLIWVGILVMSFGIGAVFPLIFGFMSQNVEVSDRVGTLLNFSSKVPGLFLPSIIGTMIETTPDILLYVMLFDLIVCSLLIVSIIIIVIQHKRA